MADLTRNREKTALIVLLAVLAILIVYRIMTDEKPRTAPLAYPPGSVARSAVREGLAAAGTRADPLNVFIAKREERFPGVSRDIFRMENPAPPKPKKAVISKPLFTAPTSTIPEKTPEQIAADLARADLAKFRFLGYLTDKDNTLFLSKDGELFIVKSGDRLLGNYQVKEAGRDSVVLLDTVTRVEVRIELSGSEGAQQQPLRPTPGRR